MNDNDNGLYFKRYQINLTQMSRNQEERGRPVPRENPLGEE